MSSQCYEIQYWNKIVPKWDRKFQFYNNQFCELEPIWTQGFLFELITHFIQHQPTYDPKVWFQVSYCTHNFVACQEFNPAHPHSAHCTYCWANQYHRMFKIIIYLCLSVIQNKMKQFRVLHTWVNVHVYL